MSQPPTALRAPSHLRAFLPSLWPSNLTQMLNSKAVRWARSKTGAGYHHTVLARHPRILSNSFPKSGTNLVSGLVTELPWIRNHKRGVTWHHVPRSLVDTAQRPTKASTIAQLRVCLPGEVFLGHVEADSEVMKFIESHGFRTLFIYRDPRDVLVSLLHWWQRDPAATWQESDTWPFRYFCTLDSDEYRLAFLIEGWPASPPAGFPQDVDFPGIGERFRAFSPWIDEPSCLPIRFEELTDPKESPDVIRGIATHLYPAASEQRLGRLVVLMQIGTDPSKSYSFREGRSGGWRQVMTDRHRELFKQHAGALLVDLGYEADVDW